MRAVRSNPSQVRSASVSQDRRKTLSSDNSRAYTNCLRTLETAYAMFGVNLDEALGLRRYGSTMKAYEVLSVAPALCHRLPWPLRGLLGAMLDHAKHFGTTPNLLPLDLRDHHGGPVRTAIVAPRTGLGARLRALRSQHLPQGSGGAAQILPACPSRGATWGLRIQFTRALDRDLPCIGPGAPPCP